MRRRRYLSCQGLIFPGSLTSSPEVRKERKSEVVANRHSILRTPEINKQKKNRRHTKSVDGILRQCSDFERLRAQTPDRRNDVYGNLKRTVVELQHAIKTDTLEHYENKARFDRSIRKDNRRFLREAIEIRGDYSFEVAAKNRKIWKFGKPAFDHKDIKKLFGVKY